MLEYYGDVIAMRHFEQGAPAEAAKWASVPIINCGDGWGEHPTQVLTDLYTTQKELGHARRPAPSCSSATCACGRCTRSSTRSRSSTPRRTSSGRPRCRSCPSSRSSSTSATCATRSPSRSRTCIADCDVIYMEPVVQPDYTKSRDEERWRRVRARRRTPTASRGELLREKAQAGVDHPAQPAADGRAARRRRRDAPRALLAGGVQRRRHAHGPPRPRARSDGVGRWSSRSTASESSRSHAKGRACSSCSATTSACARSRTGARPEGSCGACTVIVDGQAVVSCAQKATRVEGKDVVTQEGLGRRRREAWAKCFVAAGASQCGFCSPGIVMKAEALLAKNPEPSRDEIARALLGNLCRCTGYVKIVDAIELDARARRGEPLPEPDRTRPGRLACAALRGRRARARRQAVRRRPRRPGDAARGPSLLGPSRAPASCASTRRGPRPIPASSPC